MAIVELQMREQAFSNLVMHSINNRRLPSATINDPLQPSLDNKPLDSITCVGCTFEEGGVGEVTAHLDLLIRYYDSYADARAAGSLKQPATHEVHQPLPVTLRVQILQTAAGPQPKLLFSVLFNLVPDGEFDLGGLADFKVQSGAVVLGDGVVAIRLGTNFGDPVSSPAVNRLVADGDWTQIIPGELIASIFVKSLDGAVAGLAGGSYVPGGPASGGYLTTPLLGFPAPPFVLAAAKVTAVDACLGSIDVDVNLSTVATFVTNGSSIETTVRLSWSADSTWCQIVGFFTLTPISSFIIAKIASDATSNAVLGSAKSPQGFVEIGHDDNSITFRQERLLAAPAPLVIKTSNFTNDGLVISGVLHFQRTGLGLQGWVEPAVSAIHVDCSQRGVSVKFVPATVGLFDYDPPGGPPKVFPAWTRVVPDKAWTVVPTVGNSALDLVLTFAEPPSGRLPAGTATSVFLMTDCGLRWVDLGTIPADHPSPTTADVAFMISHCMAKSAAWKERVLSVNWLPRPPGDTRGLPAVRQWMLGLQDLPRDTRLEFVAISEGGHERIVGAAEGQVNVAVHITTDARETLEIRSNRNNNPTLSVVAQRWISPFAVLPLHDGHVTVAATAGLLGMRSSEGTTMLVDLSADGKLRTQQLRETAVPGAELLESAIDRTLRHGGEGWNSMAQIDEHTGAVVYGGKLLIGTLGALQTL